MRVPPDQSVTSLDDLGDRDVGITRLERPRHVIEPGAEQEGIDAVTIVGQRIEEMQEDAGIAVHRPGNVDQHDDRRSPPAPPPQPRQQMVRPLAADLPQHPPDIEPLAAASWLRSGGSAPPRMAAATARSPSSPAAIPPRSSARSPSTAAVRCCEKVPLASTSSLSSSRGMLVSFALNSDSAIRRDSSLSSALASDRRFGTISDIICSRKPGSFQYMTKAWLKISRSLRRLTNTECNVQ